MQNIFLGFLDNLIHIEINLSKILPESMCKDSMNPGDI